MYCFPSTKFSETFWKIKIEKKNLQHTHIAIWLRITECNKCISFLTYECTYRTDHRKDAYKSSTKP